MINRQLELLISLQDLDTMIREIEDVKALGFKAEGGEKLAEAKAELERKIEKPLLGRYTRLKERYKRAVVPVKEDTCLGCFMKVPTSTATKGRDNSEIIFCEGCGRILYWLQ